MYESVLGLNPYLVLVFLTLLPFLELRASIPYGIITFGTGSWLSVFLIAAVVNIILGPIVFFILDRFLHLFLKIKFINAVWEKIIVRTQKKVHPYIEKYGVLGLGLFIGIPLPGSGVYSGAIGGYLLGFSYKDFIKATIVGVLIAGTIVTLIMTTGVGAFEIFIKKV